MLILANSSSLYYPDYPEGTTFTSLYGKMVFFVKGISTVLSKTAGASNGSTMTGEGLYAARV